MNMVPEISVSSEPVEHDWYKDAIIYQLHVKAFADSNEDGIGDFNGLTQKLDYLQELGVTTLWLLPFYPSPGRDDGYDIADYGDINPQFGSMKDFRRFMVEAKRRNLRVITELVINHTSDQHAWFKRARRSPPGSSARDWYVWSDSDQKYSGTRIIFTDTEKSNWTWDPEAKAYYWHRFFSHQPDLNFDNPRVVSAVTQVMKRWLDMGVDGFRLDAVPYLCEREGTNNENLPETHAVIRKLRAELDAYASGKVLLAEANQWPEDVQYYFGAGDECHMAYHFPLMPRIYMAIAQEDRFPITDILRQTPDIPADCQWALFLRNHDELTLEMVTDVERDYLYSTYAADPRARINLGIRRRLAPLMDNDRRKIELMNSLLLSFPGTPILYYGDEIGMGDNIYLGDRNGVRTPMQWTPDRNGGFSRCDPAKLFLPPIMDAIYGYQAVNVEAQSRSISSLLSWTKRMIAVRKTSKVFGRGSLSFIRPSNRSVLAYVREYNGEVILCVANLSRTAQAAQIDLAPYKGRVPTEMLGRSKFPQIGDAPFSVTLAPYGFFWLQLAEAPEKADSPVNVPEWITLVFSDGWKSLTEGRTRSLFERDVLPPYLTSRRWFANKDAERIRASVLASVPLSADSASALTFVEVTAGEDKSCYSLPLSVHWRRAERTADEPRSTLIAPVRRANREGMLMDAVADRDTVSAIVKNIHGNVTLKQGEREIAFRATGPFANATLPSLEEIHASHGEQSNSTVLVDRAYVLKTYRRLVAGPSSEFEMGRFLAEEVSFQNSPPLLGTVELLQNGASLPVAIMHGFVENQGDAWAYTSAYLDRALEEERLLTAARDKDEDIHAVFAQHMRQMGRRVGEMHAALASRPDIEAFKPEPITSDDLARWAETLVSNAAAVFERLERDRHKLNEQTLSALEHLLSRREAALEHIRSLLPSDAGAEKIRHHGDLHLGQVLISKDDAYIIDFEGEPNRSGEERRNKAPSARDVAGMIRSIDYASRAALFRIEKATPEECTRLSAFLDDWRHRVTSAFYAGVRETAGQHDRLWPRDEAAAEKLLRFFIAEKAIYEIGYELQNRPSWLAVPVSGALRAIFGEGQHA